MYYIYIFCIYIYIYIYIYIIYNIYMICKQMADVKLLLLNSNT